MKTTTKVYVKMHRWLVDIGFLFGEKKRRCREVDGIFFVVVHQIIDIARYGRNLELINLLTNFVKKNCFQR